MNGTAAASRNTTAPGTATVVGLMFALSVMSYFDRTIMSIAGPGIMKEFGLSETEMGTVYSAFLCSYAVLMIPGGSLTDRFGPHIALTVVAVGSAVFTALTSIGVRPGLGALFGVTPPLILIRGGLGIFTAPIYPACARMNANWVTVRHRARVQGIVASGAGLGGAISPVLFSWMISRYGWRMSFVLAGIASFVLGTVWLLCVHDYPGRRSAPAAVQSSGWRALVADRNMLLLTLGFAAVDYFEYIFFFWTYYYFGEIRRLGPEQSAIYTTTLFLAWLVMTPVGGWVSDRLVTRFGIATGLRTVAISGLALSAVLLFAGAYASGTAAAVTMMALALGFASCSDVTFWAATVNIAGRRSGTACGILNSGGNLGGLVAPILTPWIASKAGWAAGLYFGSAVALAGAVAWAFIDPTRQIERMH